MTPAEAAQILDLPPSASADQVEARYNELRLKLEDKVAKAPTPGLRAKYRESLDELTAAFEVLTLAADSSSLPMLRRKNGEGSGEKGRVPETGAGAPPPLSPSAQTQDPRPSSTRKSGGREFVFVAVIAVAVLAAGGWFIMKTRAENAEKARLATEAKAEMERNAEEARLVAEAKRKAEEEEKARVVAAEKAEKERMDRLITQLRGRMAELNVNFEAQMRAESSAERELGELKSLEREHARDQKGAPNPELRRLSAQVRSQERLVDWMRTALPAHPARIAKAKAEEWMSARDVAEAAEAVDAYAAALARLKEDIAMAQGDLAVTGPLQLSANLTGVAWQMTDAFGVERSGTAPATLADVALGRGTVVFRRAGWPDLRLTVDHRKDGEGVVKGTFPFGALRVESTPPGARVFRGEELLGSTPFDLAQLPPGPVEFRLSSKGYKSRRVDGNVADGSTLTLQATLEPGRGTDVEIILERALEELPLVTDPQVRANIVLSLVTSLAKLKTVPHPALTPLLDAHLAASRAITSPKTKIEVLAYSIKEIAKIDLARSRDWAEAAVPLFASLNDPDARSTAIFLVDNFYMHPDLMARMLAPMTGWYGKSDWTYLGMLAEKHRMLGQEAEAQRIASYARDPGPYGEYQNKTINDNLATGATSRKLIPVRLALLQGDLGTAQRHFADITGMLDLMMGHELTTGFFELGDFDTPRQLARFTTSFGSPVADTLSFSLATTAAFVGNLPLAESLSARLTDTNEHKWRSNAFRVLTNLYLNQGRLAEARAALARATNLNPADTSTDRIETVKLMMLTGQPEAARRLAASFVVPMTKDRAWVVGSSAAMHAALGDMPAANRALDFAEANSSSPIDHYAAAVVSALANLGRFDDATAYLPRIKEPQALFVARVAWATGRINQTSEEAHEEVIDSAAPGLDRLATMIHILGLQVARAQAEKFN